MINRFRISASVVFAGLALILASTGVASAASPGSLDSSFGMGGVTSLAAGTELDAVAVQADREVVAVGSSGSSLLVQRFSATGASEGAFAAGSGVGRAVVVQPDGKVVVAGNDGSGMVVERFNAGGSLDPGFGSGGVVHAVPGGRAYAVALGPGGTIVAAGQVPGADAFQRIAVLRLSSSGSPDASFGPGGVRVVDLRSGFGGQGCGGAGRWQDRAGRVARPRRPPDHKRVCRPVGLQRRARFELRQRWGLGRVPATGRRGGLI